MNRYRIGGKVEEEKEEEEEEENEQNFVAVVEVEDKTRN